MTAQSTILSSKKELFQMKSMFFSAVFVLAASFSAIAETSGHPKPDRPEPNHFTPGEHEEPNKPSPPKPHKPYHPEPAVVQKPVHPIHNFNNNPNSSSTAIANPSSISNASQQQGQQQSQKVFNKIKIDNRTSSFSSLNLQTNPVYSTLGSAGSTAVPIFNINGGATNDGWGSDTAWFGTFGIQIPVNNGSDRQAIKLHKCIQILKDARELDMDLDVSAVKVCKSLKLKQAAEAPVKTNATPENFGETPAQQKEFKPAYLTPVPVPGLW
jgi:hypothetical protein